MENTEGNNFLESSVRDDVMAANKELVNIITATKLTGVSKETLLKFTEVGCLNPIKQSSDNSEELYFDKDELISLVGVAEESDVKRNNHFTPSAKAEDSETLSEKIEVSNSFTAEEEAVSAEGENISENENSLEHEKEEDHITKTFNDSTIQDSTFSTSPIEEVQTININKVSSTHFSTNHPAKNLRSYIHIIKNQDRIIANKDEQISSLEKQVSWLRSRVETAEVNSEREKMLLMTQAKTIQELSESVKNKPSIFKGILQSVGLLPPPQ